MARAVVRLSGIEAAGHHGASPGERDAPQPFVVDLEVEVEVGQDDLDATADYRILARVARGTVEGGSFVLLETIAAEVARAVRTVPGVTAVRVVVHKPAAAGRLGVADLSAEARSE